MKLAILSLTLFLGSALNESANPTEIPSYIKICNQTDPNLSSCIRKSILSLRPKFTTGIAELGIKPLEPLYIPEIVIDQIEGMQIQATFSNVSITGISSFRLRSLRTDIQTGKLLMKVWFSELSIKAVYFFRGQFLTMAINGKGLCFGNFTDIEGQIKTKLKRIPDKKTSNDHFQVDDLSIDFNIGHSQIKLENLDLIASDMNDAMNKFINENWKIVTSTLKPTLEKVISGAIRQIADSIFSKFPIKSLLAS